MPHKQSSDFDFRVRPQIVFPLERTAEAAWQSTARPDRQKTTIQLPHTVILYSRSLVSWRDLEKYFCVDVNDSAYQ
jgi:hypothetical protein